MKSVVSHQDDCKLQTCWNWWNGLTLLRFRVSRWVTAIQCRSNKGTINNICIFRGQRMSNCFGLWLLLPPGAPTPLSLYLLGLIAGPGPGVCAGDGCRPGVFNQQLSWSNRAAACLISSQFLLWIYYKNWIPDWHNSGVALFSSDCSRYCSQKNQCGPKIVFSYITQHKKKRL